MRIWDINPGYLNDKSLLGEHREWLKRNVRFLQAQRYFAGSVFIALGVVTALVEPSKK